MKLVPIIEIHKGHTEFGLPERQGLSARIKNPILHVRYWIDQGAKAVFLKDCDGVIAGKPQFSKQLEYLDGSVNETIYYCGGIRDLRSVRIFEQRKYSKIVSATSLIENKKFLRNILANNIGPIALWIDSVDGFVYTRNATRPIGKRTIDLLRSLPEFGIDEIFFCSRSEQGPALHPDRDTIEHILDLGIEKLYVADNISSKEDLKILSGYEKYGLAGIAINQSLYNGTFTLQELKNIFHYETIDL
ncbi:MAG: HisA/HisF-related TIM barrel protein [Brevinema sp.]